MNDLETLLEPLIESAPEPVPMASVRGRAARVRRRRRALALTQAVALAIVVAIVVALAVPRSSHEVRTVAPPPTTSAPRPLHVGAPRPFNQYGMDMVSAYGSVWLSQTDRVARLDPTDGRVLATISVPGESDDRSVVAGAGSVWVDDTATEMVTRIDPRRNRVTATIPLAHAPKVTDGMAFLDGRVWIARPDPEGQVGDIVAIDPATNRVSKQTPIARSFDVQAGADALWYEPDGGTRAGSDLVRLDPRTLRATVVRHDSVHAIVAIAGAGIWVQTDRGVIELDQRSGAQIGGVIRPRGTVNVTATVADGVLWLASQPDSSTRGSVTPYDAVTHRVLGREIPVGLPILGLASTPGAVWVNTYQQEGVTRIPYTR